MSVSPTYLFRATRNVRVGFIVPLEADLTWSTKLEPQKQSLSLFLQRRRRCNASHIFKDTVKGWSDHPGGHGGALFNLVFRVHELFPWLL